MLKTMQALTPTTRKYTPGTMEDKHIIIIYLSHQSQENQALK